MTRSRILTVQGELSAEAGKLGLRVFSYAPGDGARRYRLVLASDCAESLGVARVADWGDASTVALASLVGPRAVRDWLAGYAAGLVDGRLGAIREGAARRAPATAPAGGDGSIGVRP